MSRRWETYTGMLLGISKGNLSCNEGEANICTSQKVNPFKMIGLQYDLAENLIRQGGTTCIDSRDQVVPNWFEK